MKNIRVAAAAVALVVAASLGTPATAQGLGPDAGLSQYDRNVFFFGGRFHSTSFYDSAFVWALP
ncbi:hypothetical protein, partial [Devosia sp.]|uniref:hypothetical protein n=1 Tax=Devosia sp. TaxID=1871048 RepID=UPI0035AD8DFB